MNNEFVNSIITILAVILGGLITYLFQNAFAKRDSLRNKKQEIYLQFLEHATSVHSLQFTDTYFDIIREMYLVASIDVINTMVKYHYIPKDGEKFERPKKEEEPLKHIIIAMRKDLGYKIKGYDNVQLIHWHSNDTKR